MSKDEALLRYKTAISVFKKWLTADVISTDEFLEIEQMLSAKYGLSSFSIYRENDLLS